MNKVRNPEFRLGTAVPRHWNWACRGRGGRWRRNPDRPGGVTIESDVPRSACWSQELACRPGEFYRVEATIYGDVSTSATDGGAVLQVQPLGNRRAAGDPRTTPPLYGAFATTIVRAYFHAPVNVRRARLSVGLLDARGELTVENVRFMHILEPDATSHPLAIPPPPWSQRLPRVVHSIQVCAASCDERPLTDRLRQFFGAACVAAHSSDELDPRRCQADALLLPDASPPPRIRTLQTLLTLASGRVVVISPSAFAELSKGALAVRRIVQPDDPIHAKVMLSNFATCGFALHDVFPFAATPTDGSFVQNQFRKTPEFSAFCKKHGLETLLNSMCERDATSDKPIALFKPTPNGALLVLDLEPCEGEGSTMSEPVPAMHLLLSILGRTQAGQGQYTVPVRSQTEFRGMIRECGVRFEQLVVHDDDGPVVQDRSQLVTVGRDDESFGLPLRPKPVIIVRSGLVSGDVESVYGALAWFKQLIRPAPYACPYADPLASRFRLAWVPYVAGWEYAEGWRASRSAPTIGMDLELDDAEVAAVIDVVSYPINRVRLALAKADRACEHYETWLPRLFDSFGPAGALLPSVAEGDAFADRRRFAWRSVRHRIETIVDSGEFTDDLHRAALAHGAMVMRLEVPGWEANFAAHSIARTDLVATLLEHVIGLQYGIIAVNRGHAPVQIDGFAPVGPGHALIVERGSAAFRAADAG